MVTIIPACFTRLEVLFGGFSYYKKTAQYKIACKFCQIFSLLVSTEISFESSNGNTEQSLSFKAGD